MALYAGWHHLATPIQLLRGLLWGISESYTGADGNAYDQFLISYDYTTVTYSGAAGNTWNASWLTGFSSPGNSLTLSGLDQITIGAGTYPHWYQMSVSDATEATTTKFFNSREQLTGAVLPTGLTLTNFYDASGFLHQSIAQEIQATNTYTFANGLPYSRVNPDGLLTTYTWDNLQRLTGVNFRTTRPCPTVTRCWM